MDHRSDPNLNATLIRVYVTTVINLDDIPQLLYNEGDDGGWFWEIGTSPGRTAQQICAYHRANVRAGGEVHSELFLIFNRQEPERRGVLVVNIEPYHGYADAFRYLPNDAASSLEALATSFVSWYEEREVREDAKTELVPVNWFALYNLLPSARQGDFERTLRAMNEGIQEVNSGNEPEEPAGEVRPFHRGVRPDTDNLGQIISEHLGYAIAQNLDPERFAVVDERFETDGILIVQAEPPEGAFRCKGPAAGELLAWIFIGFMTWDEARVFAYSQ